MLLPHDDQPLDRAEVERIAYQAIGHQFRLPALFSVVLLVLGFVLGHYVAARHMQTVTDRLEDEIAKLHATVDSITRGMGPAMGDPLALTGTSGMAALRGQGIDQANADPFISLPFSSAPRIRLSGLQRTAAVESDSSVDAPGLKTAPSPSAESISRVTAQITAAKTTCLEELQPYVEKRMSINATTVARVIESIFDEEESRVRSLLDQDSPPFLTEFDSHPAAIPRSTFRSEADRSERMFPPSESTIQDAPATGELPSAPAGVAQVAAKSRYFSPPKASGMIYFSAAGSSAAKSHSRAATND